MNVEPTPKPKRKRIAAISAAISAFLTLIIEALAVSEPILDVIFQG